MIRYTTGVFDLFNIGHLNILRNSKAMCDKLIVGVTTDSLAKYKGKTPIIPFSERYEIVRSIRYVDAVIPQEHLDKYKAWKKLKFNVLFVGDDWYSAPRWKKIEKKFDEVGVRVVYFPYTKGSSSSLINQVLVKERKKLR